MTFFLKKNAKNVAFPQKGTGYTLSEEEKKKLDGFNAVFVETWRMLSDLQNDFQDLIDELFRKMDASMGKGV